MFTITFDIIDIVAVTLFSAPILFVAGSLMIDGVKANLKERKRLIKNRGGRYE